MTYVYPCRIKKINELTDKYSRMLKYKLIQKNILNKKFRTILKHFSNNDLQKLENCLNAKTDKLLVDMYLKDVYIYLIKEGVFSE